MVVAQVPVRKPNGLVDVAIAISGVAASMVEDATEIKAHGVMVAPIPTLPPSLTKNEMVPFPPRRTDEDAVRPSVNAICVPVALVALPKCVGKTSP